MLFGRMGRITIFTTDGCPNCRRAKMAMTSRSLPYVEIDIMKYPNRRGDMTSLLSSNETTSVPRIFVNDVHLGGSDELIDMLEGWDRGDHRAAEPGSTTTATTMTTTTTAAAVSSTPLDVYNLLVGDRPDPVDMRLAPPKPAVVGQTVDDGGGGGGGGGVEFDIHKSRSRDVVAIRGREYACLELTRILLKYMPRDSLWRRGTRYHDAFVGTSGVDALRDIFDLDTKDEAVSLGLALQARGYLHHVSRDDERSLFGDNSSYFVLRPFRYPNVLNSLRAWNAVRVDKPMCVVNRLSKLWNALESRHLTDSGLVDHGPDFRNDDMYWRFEEDACELQDIRLVDMNDDARLAFVINLYNVMIKYAFCKVGIPLTSSDRASFYGDVSVDVGGDILSFDDLEHGILRGNTRHPYQLARRFTTPNRQRLALSRLDPRIHFALNCGANSCPPIKWYTPEGIDRELQLAAMAFCEHDDNVRIDEENRQVHFSKLLHWYQSDFAPSKDDLPKAVAKYLSKEKKSKLDRLTKDGNFGVKFIDYDWSNHGSVNTMRYEKGDLSSRTFLPFIRNPPPRKYVKDDSSLKRMR
ncbi:hypothetical protein ACHAXA_001951 [Cyclostephanos tholiformis]|uniref:DEP domain-containing protein n=1 Tax=Cyclostephanos tholiformis TaxID=382380 RepID=A0ABD3R152_9STRA